MQGSPSGTQLRPSVTVGPVRVTFIVLWGWVWKAFGILKVEAPTQEKLLVQKEKEMGELLPQRRREELASRWASLRDRVTSSGKPTCIASQEAGGKSLRAGRAEGGVYT